MDLERRFADIVLTDPLCRAALNAARDCGLPQGNLAAAHAGCLEMLRSDMHSSEVNKRAWQNGDGSTENYQRFECRKEVRTG